jgi:antitoxin (DNA-binding transcriptional repressor) of toxin-antitoxin stability system
MWGKVPKRGNKTWYFYSVKDGVEDYITQDTFPIPVLIAVTKEQYSCWKKMNIIAKTK